MTPGLSFTIGLMGDANYVSMGVPSAEAGSVFSQDFTRHLRAGLICAAAARLGSCWARLGDQAALHRPRAMGLRDGTSFRRELCALLSGSSSSCAVRC